MFNKNIQPLAFSCCIITEQNTSLINGFITKFEIIETQLVI